MVILVSSLSTTLTLTCLVRRCSTFGSLYSFEPPNDCWALLMYPPRKFILAGPVAGNQNLSLLNFCLQFGALQPRLSYSGKFWISFRPQSQKFVVTLQRLRKLTLCHQCACRPKICKHPVRGRVLVQYLSFKAQIFLIRLNRGRPIALRHITGRQIQKRLIGWIKNRRAMLIVDRRLRVFHAPLDSALQIVIAALRVRAFCKRG